MVVKATKRDDSEQGRHLDKAYGKQGSNVLGDFGRTWDGVGNFLSQVGKNVGDFSGTVSDYTGLNKDAGLTGLLRKLQPRSTSTSNPAGYDTTPGGRKGGRSRPNTSNASRRPAGQESAEEQQMSFADYLAMANEMGMGGTPDYSGMKQQLRDNAVSGDARLNAMYAKLTGDIAADATGIAQNYDNAGTAIAASADQAQATTNQGYDSARAAQTAQLSALGIGEAAGTLAANGGFAAGDQGAANANIEQAQLAGTQQATANKASALNYNTGVKNASALEGNVQRALVQQRLAEQLAEIGMQEQKDSVSSRQSNFSAAASMMENANSGRANQLETEKADRQQDIDNQFKAEYLKLDQAKAGGSKQTLMQQLQGNSEGYAYAQKLAQDYGFDPSNPEAMTIFLKQLNSLS